jgi:hypothetical protein
MNSWNFDVIYGKIYQLLVGAGIRTFVSFEDLKYHCINFVQYAT